MRSEPFRVALISMPFQDAFRPSIQIGLLSSILNQKGIEVISRHFYLDFANLLGLRAYQAFTQFRNPQFGEWFFALEAFKEDRSLLDAEFLDNYPIELEEFLRRSGLTRDELLHHRIESVPEYLRRLLQSEDWSRYAVIGFSCTFEQNTASFALARAIKEAVPKVTIVFGGSNFDDEMGREWFRRMIFIDAVVQGEADASFPRFVQGLREGEVFAQDSVLFRGKQVESELREPQEAPDIEKSPVPDYDDYFLRLEDSGLTDVLSGDFIAIPFESARGCWWGSKQHCVFCGLNGSNMEFRSKPAKAVEEELAFQADRYGIFKFSSVDNILDNRYLTTLLPTLANQQLDYNIFYEVKANLSREQIRTLATAGVRSIQPGIESLSTPILRQMRKGVRASQNVNLLRWALYYGIDIAWNLLWGFPDEEEKYYQAQTSLMPLLAHLQPPGAAGRIRMERFSPVFEKRQELCEAGAEPSPSYDYIYPAAVEKERIAYFFDYTFKSSLAEDAFSEIKARIDVWQRRWHSKAAPSLNYLNAGNLIKIIDRRFEEEKVFHLKGDVAAIYLAITDLPLSTTAILNRIPRLHGETVKSVLTELALAGLVMEDEGLYVALAIPSTRGR
jgi:ribosomal peptide maturation radical SAM protein 1